MIRWQSGGCRAVPAPISLRAIGVCGTIAIDRTAVRAQAA
jgi:hypothetical protein